MGSSVHDVSRHHNVSEERRARQLHGRRWRPTSIYLAWLASSDANRAPSRRAPRRVGQARRPHRHRAGGRHRCWRRRLGSSQRDTRDRHTLLRRTGGQRHDRRAQHQMQASSSKHNHKGGEHDRRGGSADCCGRSVGDVDRPNDGIGARVADQQSDPPPGGGRNGGQPDPGRVACGEVKGHRPVSRLRPLLVPGGLWLDCRCPDWSSWFLEASSSRPTHSQSSKRCWKQTSTPGLGCRPEMLVRGRRTVSRRARTRPLRWLQVRRRRNTRSALRQLRRC